MVTLRMLPALSGDCIMLRFLEIDLDYMIMIDSGMGRECIKKLKAVLYNRSVDSALDLWILTHIDSDHISGILYLLRDERIDGNVIKEIWFNYGEQLDVFLQSQGNDTAQLSVENVSEKTSYKQGTELYQVLHKRNIHLQSPIRTGDMYNFSGIKITVLSPSERQLKKLISSTDYHYESDNSFRNKTACRKNDYRYSMEELLKREFNETGVSVTNASSIAMLVEYKGLSLLLLGDAKASEIVDALEKRGYSEENKLHVDFCKIAHHGSANNTSDTLVKMIDCKNYLISSNWKNGKPSKECLSRIVVNSLQEVNFLCNYEPNRGVFSTDEQKRYGMKFIYVSDKEFEIYAE